MCDFQYLSYVEPLVCDFQYLSYVEPVKEQQSDPGFVEKLVTQIIKNVQVKKLGT